MSNDSASCNSFDCVTAIDNSVSGDNLVTSLYVNLIIGGLCLLGFVVWRTQFPIYTTRLQVPGVRKRPPKLPTNGFKRVWSWMAVLRSVSDKEFLASAGFDALVSVRVISYGIALFLPFTILGIGVLLPVNYTGGNLAQQEGVSHDSSNLTYVFLRMTISNIENGSPLLWIHCVFLFLFVFWASYLLLVFYEEHIAMCHTVAAARIGPQHAMSQEDYDETLITEDAETAATTPKATPAHKPSRSSLLARRKKSTSAFEEMPTLTSDDNKLRSMSSLKRRGSSLGAWPEQLTADPTSASEPNPSRPENQSELTDYYELWPVRRGDAPNVAASRPPYAGQYTVIVVDEPTRRFEIKEKPKFMGMPLRLSRMESLRETQKGTNIQQNWYWLGGAMSKRFSKKRDTINAGGGSSFSHSASLAVGMVDGDHGDDGDYVDVENNAGNGVEGSSEANKSGVMIESHDIEDPGVPIDAVESKQEQGTDTTAAAATASADAATTTHTTTNHTTTGGGVLKPAKSAMKLVGTAAGKVITAGGSISASLPWENKIYKEQQAMRQLGARMRVVASTFQRLFGDDFDSIIPVYPTESVDNALAKLYWCQAKLARFELQLEAAEQKAERLIEKEETAALQAGNSTSTSSPTSKTSPLSKVSGCFAPTAASATKKVEKLRKKVDALYAKELELQTQVTNLSSAVLDGPPCQTFIATFRTAKAAAMALQLNVNPVHWRGAHLMPGPDADNVNWTALQRGWWSRQIRSMIVIVAVIFIMLFPAGLITGMFSQLEVALCGGSQGDTGSLTGTWFCSDDPWAKFLRNIITGILPSIIMSVYQGVLLPMYIYSCALGETRHLSLTELDRRCAELFFHWNWCNFFLQTLLGGALFNGLRQAIQDPSSIVTLIGNAVPASANFFINYVLYRAFAMTFFRLFWPHASVLSNILQWLYILPKPKTPQDVAFATPLRNCRYSRDIGVSTFAIYVSAIAYSIIAPFILPVALIYFILMLFVWRYQQLYVFQAAYNSRGYIWSFAAHRVVACLGILVLLTSCMFLVKAAYVQGLIALIGLEIFIIAFDKYIKTRYDEVFASTPIAILEAAPKVELDPQLYVPAPLRKGAEGWYLEWGKAWQGWGVGRYV